MTDKYFTEYNSPNIVIVPTKSYDDPSKNRESEAESKSSTDDTNKSIPILIQGTTSESCSDVNSHANMNAKNESWSSNYLQSIGLSDNTSTLNRRGKISSHDNAVLLTEDSSPAKVGPYQTAAPNINYSFGQSSSIPDNTIFPNYNNIVSYSGYENNNYYYDQPINTTRLGCCSTCYGTVENLPNTYLNTCGQPSNIGHNTSHMVQSTYYDTNATSTLASFINLPYSESCSFISSNTQTINTFSQTGNLINSNTLSTFITPCEDNRCPTPLIDENILTSQLTTFINANSPVTKLTNIKSSDMDEKNLSSGSISRIDEKTCNCICSKRHPDAHDEQNTETQKNTDKALEQMSSVQANERAFRDFLRKLKIDRPPEKETKLNSSTKIKKRKTKSIEKSSVQENEKAFRKLLQKFKMKRKPVTEKSENKHLAKKNTSSKDRTLSDEKTISSSENKIIIKDPKQKEEISKDTKQKEEERPKYIKTKYVDEQEPEYKPIKKARLEKYCKTKIITTKYTDEQKPDFKPNKKFKLDSNEIKEYSCTKSKSSKYSEKQELECKPIKKVKNDSDFKLKKYSNIKTIPTKYIDEQEPVYKPVIKARNDSDYEHKKYSNTNTISPKYVDDIKYEYKKVKKTRIDSSSEFTKPATQKYDTTNVKINGSKDASGDTYDKFCKKYDTDYKIKTYKTESTKYYKYGTEDCLESRKQTPVKSVVKISKMRKLKKSPLYNILEEKDLRDKLSRKLHSKTEESKEEICKRKPSEESNDNLIITVNNNINENNVSPVENNDKLKTKTESCKKINLVINIVYKQPGSRSESEKSDSDGNSPQANADLSFLDDFNVDEIVASLNKTEKISMHQNAQTEASNVTSVEGRIEKTDTSNVLIKRENLEISKAQMILEKGNILNNLLAKEGSILDSLRIIHEEIESEKRSCHEQNNSFLEGQNELPEKDNKSCPDAQLKTDIKNKTVFNKSINGNVTLEESKNGAENNIDSLRKASQSPLNVLMKHLKKTGHAKDLSEIINNGEVKKESKSVMENDMRKNTQSELLKILQDTKEDTIEVMQTKANCTPQRVWVSDKVSNNLNTYDDDITSFYEEDERRQSEYLKILHDTKEDKIEVIQTKVNCTPQTVWVSDKVSNNMNAYDEDIIFFDEEDKKRQSELLKILQDMKEDKVEVIQTKAHCMPQTVRVSDKVSNNMNTYDDNITSFDEEDKRRQSELLKILQDTKEDKIEVTQTKANCTPQTERVSDKFSNNINAYDEDITFFDEEDKKRQSELLKILQDMKEDKVEVIQTKANCMPQTERFSDKVSNNMNAYDEDITVFDKEDKKRQSELLKILEDTKEDDIESFKKETNRTQTANVIEKVSSVTTIIDLSSDDSNDSYKPKKSDERSLDDVYIVEEKSGKNIIETIDLTTIENLNNTTVTTSLETAKALNNSPDTEKVLIEKQKSNNKEAGKKDKLSNESQDTQTGTAAKVVAAIKDAIIYLKRSENFIGAMDKLNKDAIVEVPATNMIKETVVEAIEVSNIQHSRNDTQSSDKRTSDNTEDESSATRMLTRDCNEIQEEVIFVRVTKSENVAKRDAEKVKHKNEKEQINLKDDVTIINTIKEITSDITNNTKIDETIFPQAVVDVKNEKSLSTETKFDKGRNRTTIEDCNTVKTIKKDNSQTFSVITSFDSFDKQKVKDENVKEIAESQTKINIEEIKNTAEQESSPKAKEVIKTASNLKTIPSTSDPKIHSPSLTVINKNKTNSRAGNVKVENTNKISTVPKNKHISIIAGKLELEMLQCFNKTYNWQGLIHLGTYSKIFHFTSFSGRDYAVKSYNDWHSVFKYIEKKDMLLAMQEGHMRHTYGCVYLINSFLMQDHLCLLMDYYPKNLKQALAENEKPFHINVVRHLAVQLVSAVMLLKSHDVVHLDIKPTHILLNHKNDRLKLCGFDAARYINKIPILPNLGTINYRPPEVIVGYKVGFDADVWATALVMYEMITGIQLFPGIHDNDILFKQMCTLGALPVEMIHRSHFSNSHFTGSSFKRVLNYKPNKINIITKFYKTKRLESTIINAYNENWRSTATEQELMVDKQRITSLIALLREMLEVDPGDRMPIQFVNAHPFLTDEY